VLGSDEGRRRVDWKVQPCVPIIYSASLCFVMRRCGVTGVVRQNSVASASLLHSLPANDLQDGYWCCGFIIDSILFAQVVLQSMCALRLLIPQFKG